MRNWRVLSISEQIAAHLREEIARGVWVSTIPGRLELARQLDVGVTSVERALKDLEIEGILAPQGVGRERMIVAGADKRRKRKLMRIAILPHEKSNLSGGIFADAHHALRDAGHDAFFSHRTLLDLGMDVQKVEEHVNSIRADAWVVCAAAREVNQWFSQQAFPAFAFFGRRRGMPMASTGPDKTQAVVQATEKLIELGHKRIVMLVRPDRRVPTPGAQERSFLATIHKHFRDSSHTYHLPDWDEGRASFQARLKGLFSVTPPTALIVDEPMLFLATLQFLSRRGIRVPEDVSLVSMESSEAFDWCSPAISRIQWDRAAVIRRVVQWANHLSRGKKDVRETHAKAKFVVGETIAEVKVESGGAG